MSEDNINYDQPRHTFGLNNCRDLCEKLNRELFRLNTEIERGHDREAIADHAVNFAVTAWHLIDWIWCSYKDNRLQLHKDAMTASQAWKNFEDFKKYILDREPKLHSCGLIANTAKHLVLTDKRWADQNDTSAVFIAAESQVVVGGEEVVIDGENVVVSIWKPTIVDGDDCHDACAEFAAISSFWTHFVHGETIEK